MATVRFFAAAAEAAGVEEAQFSASATGQLREELVSTYGTTFGQVLAQCALLVDGTRCDEDAPLSEASRVDVLPPFAGG